MGFAVENIGRPAVGAGGLGDADAHGLGDPAAKGIVGILSLQMAFALGADGLDEAVVRVVVQTETDSGFAGLALFDLADGVAVAVMLVKGALILLQEIAGDEGEPGPLGRFGSGKRLQVGEALVPVGMVPGIGIGEEAAFRGGIEQIAGRVPGELLIQVGAGGAQQLAGGIVGVVGAAAGGIIEPGEVSGRVPAVGALGQDGLVGAGEALPGEARPGIVVTGAGEP